ncbi:MAG: Fe-S metabolism protein SufE [Bacteroidetes bacterium CG23_combo_of_CG06-09_8_20_14_all_32_9]|nr:MAG: Fe-S metabolism protein SufE [Bacteroidetes bacterium CG23_combo_of_CG06-09_8_20_14_all_32_9]
MTIDQIQEQIVEEFSVFTDWMEKYTYLIELSKELQGFKEEFRINQNLIKGCQSQVWLQVEFKNGKIIFYADSDTVLTKGMIALLIRVLSNRTPEEIVNAKLWFVDKIGLTTHLSPTRSNGLISMIKQIKLYAIAYKTKYNI